MVLNNKQTNKQQIHKKQKQQQQQQQKQLLVLLKNNNKIKSTSNNNKQQNVHSSKQINKRQRAIDSEESKGGERVLGGSFLGMRNEELGYRKWGWGNMAIYLL